MTFDPSAMPGEQHEPEGDVSEDEKPEGKDDSIDVIAHGRIGSILVLDGGQGKPPGCVIRGKPVTVEPGFDTGRHGVKAAETAHTECEPGIAEGGFQAGPLTGYLMPKGPAGAVTAGIDPCVEKKEQDKGREPEGEGALEDGLHAPRGMVVTPCLMRRRRQTRSTIQTSA